MINYISTPFRWFFKLEAASGLILLIFAIFAVIVSNSNISDFYFNLLNTHILVGTKNFGNACYKRIKEINLKKGSCSNHPHQIYFEFLSEHGIVGTLIILIIFLTLIIKSFKNYLIYQNKIHLGALIYLILVFLPMIPSGSFFGNFNSTFFWINVAIMLAFEKKHFTS